MGLGKTIIALACSEELLGCGDITSTLVVVPASLKFHWAQQVAASTDLPGVPFRVKDRHIIVPRPEHCTVINGSPAARKLQYQRIAQHHPEYVILGYENVVNDSRYVRAINPGLVILDECTAIKTFRAKRTKQIKRLLYPPFRIGLTGTPVENKPEELFSIMEWVDPEARGRFDLFVRTFIKRDHFGRVEKYRNLPVLRKKIAPAIARKSRLDPDVAPHLPEVDHGTWSVPMPPALREAYRRICADLHKELAAMPALSSFDLAAYYAGRQGSEENSALGKVMARQTALEMLLAHPRLLIRSADSFRASLGDKGSKYVSSLLADGFYPDVIPTPKTDYIAGIVPEILSFDQGNKILIFSRFLGMQDIFASFLAPGSFVKYHGQLSAAEKTAAIARFTDDKDCRVFLSSHAGAYGNDMHMANYLINYDLPWSAGRADQINGRHVRASSAFPSVAIRDLIAAGTIEERRQQLLALKRKVGSAILDGHGQDEQGAVVNDLQTLMSHLTEVLGLP